MDINEIVYYIKNSVLPYLKVKNTHPHVYVSEAYLEYQQARRYEYQSKLNYFNPNHTELLLSNRDERNAIWCFLHSASKGYSSAQFKLGQCYLNGQLGLASNTFKAQEWLALAANQGHIEAQTELTKIHNAQLLS